MLHQCSPNLNLHTMGRSLKKEYIKHISNKKWILYYLIKKTQFDRIKEAIRILGRTMPIMMKLKSHLLLSQLAINMIKMKITNILIEILKVFKITEALFHREICKKIAFNYYQIRIRK